MMLTTEQKREEFAMVMRRLEQPVEVSVTGEQVLTFDVAPYVRRLIAANGGWSEESSLFLTDGNEETVAVAHEIAASYGKGGLVAVHMTVRRILPEGLMRDLSNAWNGIEGWMG